MLMNMIQKLSSVRVIMALVITAVFAYLAIWTDKLDKAFVAGVITLVVEKYFSRPDRNTGTEIEKQKTI